jgi:hypothetical protein
LAQSADGTTVTVAHCKTGLELVTPEKKSVCCNRSLIIITVVIIALKMTLRLNRRTKRFFISRSPAEAKNFSPTLCVHTSSEFCLAYRWTDKQPNYSYQLQTKCYPTLFSQGLSSGFRDFPQSFPVNFGIVS